MRGSSTVQDAVAEWDLLPDGDAGGHQRIMHNKRRVIIFDGDDTLWKTQELFDEAKAAFADLLRAERLGGIGTIPRLDEIDEERVSTVGFSPRRFTGSMIHLYSFLCRKKGRDPDAAVESRIEIIGDAVKRTPDLYDDALPVLEALSNQFLLVLATKGDREVQARKIKALGIEPFFWRIYVLPKKTEREYARIINELAVSSTDVIIVGNSARSDINPASRLGLKSFLIPRGTWSYEETGLEPGSVHVVGSLSEVAANLASQASASSSA